MEDTRLVRSLSAWPDGGIVENIGAPLAFEAPFWAGERPAVIDPDPDEPPALVGVRLAPLPRPRRQPGRPETLERPR